MGREDRRGNSGSEALSKWDQGGLTAGGRGEEKRVGGQGRLTSGGKGTVGALGARRSKKQPAGRKEKRGRGGMEREKVADAEQKGWNKTAV